MSFEPSLEQDEYWDAKEEVKMLMIDPHDFFVRQDEGMKQMIDSYQENEKELAKFMHSHRGRLYQTHTQDTMGELSKVLQQLRQAPARLDEIRKPPQPHELLEANFLSNLTQAFKEVTREGWLQGRNNWQQFTERYQKLVKEKFMQIKRNAQTQVKLLVNYKRQDGIRLGKLKDVAVQASREQISAQKYQLLIKELQFYQNILTGRKAESAIFRIVDNFVQQVKTLAQEEIQVYKDIISEDPKRVNLMKKFEALQEAQMKARKIKYSKREWVANDKGTMTEGLRPSDGSQSRIRKLILQINISNMKISNMHGHLKLLGKKLARISEMVLPAAPSDQAGGRRSSLIIADNSLTSFQAISQEIDVLIEHYRKNNRIRNRRQSILVLGKKEKLEVEVLRLKEKSDKAVKAGEYYKKKLNSMRIIYATKVRGIEKLKKENQETIKKYEGMLKKLSQRIFTMQSSHKRLSGISGEAEGKGTGRDKAKGKPEGQQGNTKGQEDPFWGELKEMGIVNNQGKPIGRKSTLSRAQTVRDLDGLDNSSISLVSTISIEVETAVAEVQTDPVEPGGFCEGHGLHANQPRKSLDTVLEDEIDKARMIEKQITGPTKEKKQETYGGESPSSRRQRSTIDLQGSEETIMNRLKSQFKRKLLSQAKEKSRAQRRRSEEKRSKPTKEADSRAELKRLVDVLVENDLLNTGNLEKVMDFLSKPEGKRLIRARAKLKAQQQKALVQRNPPSKAKKLPKALPRARSKRDYYVRPLKAKYAGAKSTEVLSKSARPSLKQTLRTGQSQQISRKLPQKSLVSFNNGRRGTEARILPRGSQGQANTELSALKRETSIQSIADSLGDTSITFKTLTNPKQLSKLEMEKKLEIAKRMYNEYRKVQGQLLNGRSLNRSASVGKVRPALDFQLNAKGLGHVQTFSQFQKYFFRFIFAHQTCGETCQHLLKFYQRCGILQSKLPKTKKPYKISRLNIREIPKPKGKYSDRERGVESSYNRRRYFKKK